MSDGGNFDPCECVWSHEMAMQRLMNLVCHFICVYCYLAAYWAELSGIVTRYSSVVLTLLI
jgi:Protein of unknown function (DUF2615)